MQIRHGSTSERGLHQTRSRVAQASEPENNSNKPLQLVERLSVVRFQQASPPVQMRRQRGASEPCSKAESGSQLSHNKRIAGLSATATEVQMPAGLGMPQIANVPRRCFWRGGPQNVQQNSPGHLNRKEIQEIHCNTLENFLLHGFNKHLHRFRCSGKVEHLNLAARQNLAVNPLTTNALQNFQQLCPRFRSQTGLEGNRLQMCPGGASGWGTPERANRTAQASEPG